ncbi:hypothetical protein C0J26_09795 [Pseudomonas baetica]|nr:hypothetical protein C0J26_09795 [Pseudomonas baetica]
MITGLANKFNAAFAEPGAVIVGLRSAARARLWSIILCQTMRSALSLKRMLAIASDAKGVFSEIYLRPLFKLD